MSEASVVTPLLLSPYQMRGITAKNRIMVSPMCQYASLDGAATDFHLVHLGQFALGGAGIIFCEETSVEDIGRKTHTCAGLYKASQVSAYRNINRFLHEQGALSGIQLGHAGRKASCREPWHGFQSLDEADAAKGLHPWQTIAPSPVAQPSYLGLPHELTQAELTQHVEQWRHAALLAAEADYDIVEIHIAHGYLLHQFLSPLANQRQDTYGGSLEGRMRLSLEVVEAVRKVWPADKPLFARLSATDGEHSGWTIDDTLILARALKERGVDCITPSSGGVKGPTAVSVVARAAGYHVPYARRIRQEVDIPTIAVGLITDAQQAEDILREGSADIIALARELLWDPYWPAHAARALGDEHYLDLLPSSYAWWLARREQIRALT
jgi:2,4-dienoyl-CoA reductase-like NADH-dependent reductase (Old Yellow Enzyme family)